MTNNSGRHQRKVTGATNDLRQRLLQGSLWSAAFQVFSKVALFLVGALVARRLNVEGLGIFLAVQGGVILAAAVADRGISLSVEREAAASAIAAKTLARLFKLRSGEALLASAVTYGVLQVVAPSLSWTAKAAFSVAAGAVYISYLSNSMLQSQQRFRQSAVIQSIGRLVYLLGVLTIFSISPHIATAAFAWALGESTTAILQWRNTRRILAQMGNAPETEGAIRAVMRRALPYWAAMVAFLAYNRFDAALCLMFSDARQAGYYGPATNIQTALMIIPGALTASLAVVGASTLKSGLLSTSALISEVSRLAKTAFWVSVAASVAVTAAAPVIIHMYVGGRFGASVAPTRILVWSLPFNAIQGALLGLLVALGQPKRTVYFYLTCFAVSLAGNWVLTPALGANGAAIAALAREPIGTAVLGFMVRRVAHGMAGSDHYRPSSGVRRSKGEWSAS